MLNTIIKDTLIPDILSSSSTGELPYLPASSLRGALRTGLTKLADNLIASNSNNNLKVILSPTTGSGKTCIPLPTESTKNCLFLLPIIGAIASETLPHWKQNYSRFWARLPNQKMAYRPGFELLTKKAITFTSTGIIEPGINFDINWLNFGSEPNRQKNVQRCGRFGRTDSLRSSSNSCLDMILFSYAPVQCLLPKWKQTSKEVGLLLIQEIDNSKYVKCVGLPDCNYSLIKLLNPCQGIETSPVLYRKSFHKIDLSLGKKRGLGSFLEMSIRLLPLCFFADLIPTRGLKHLFTSNNQKFGFRQRIFKLFANSRLRLNKVLTSDCRKAIQLSLLRWQFEKINLRKHIINYLSLLKDEGYQLLDNQSHLFGWTGINIRRLAGYLVLMRELLFRSFMIDNRCDFISLVDIPP